MKDSSLSWSLFCLLGTGQRSNFPLDSAAVKWTKIENFKYRKESSYFSYAPFVLDYALLCYTYSFASSKNIR